MACRLIVNRVRGVGAVAPDTPLQLIVTPAAVASALAVGAPTVTGGDLAVNPESVGSSAGVGQPVVGSGQSDVYADVYAGTY